MYSLFGTTPTPTGWTFGGEFDNSTFFNNIYTLNEASSGSATGSTSVTNPGGYWWYALQFEALAPASGTAYTMAAASGAYAIAGSTASLVAKRKLAAASGAYAIAGSTASLIAGRKLAAASGAYAIAGSAASLIAGRKLAAAAGAYAIAGSTATLTYTPGTGGVHYTMAAAAGAYAIAGSAASLVAKRKLAAAAGSYALSGSTATLVAARKLAAASGAYAIAGSAASFKVTWHMAAASGAYAIAGSAASLAAARKLAAASGAYAIAGSAATLTYTPGTGGVHYTMAAASGAYAIAGSTASLVAKRKLAAAAGAYAIAGSAATLTYTPGTGGVHYTMADCSNGAQSPDWCPSTVTEVLPSVLGVLPSGPAWDGGAQPGTVMNMFWTAVADVLAWVYARLCAYMLEFLCSTAVESVDQWMVEYGLPDQCDPFGYNLCAKVNALFEPTCAGYVAIAAANGWVIECDNTPIPEPIAGCFQCGCTPLGPTPVYLGGSNLGVGALSPCDYGSVVHHPQPWFWNNAIASQASCPVPGTNLGQGPDTAHGEACCFIVGWMPAPEALAPTPPPADACVGGDTIYFDCPTYARPQLVFKSWDRTGKFTNYSQAYVWRVTVNLAASLALQGKPVATGPTSQAGNFQAGCTPLCAQSVYTDMLCFLQTIAPAHAVLVTNVSNTL